MNRRSFLKRLGVGAVATAAVVSAPELVTKFLEVPPIPEGYATYIMGSQAVIADYANYANFSTLALSEAMDEVVTNAAIELAKKQGMRVRWLVS